LSSSSNNNTRRFCQLRGGSRKKRFVAEFKNWKKHIRGASGIDGRSSGFWFDGWAKAPPSPTTPSPVAPARTWLASRGWRERGGGPIGVDEMPAARGGG